MRRTADGGRGGFTVDSDGRTAKGELQWQKARESFHAREITAVGIAADGRSAWLAGRSADGRTFLAHAGDRGEPGRDDRFRLWIDGLL